MCLAFFEQNLCPSKGVSNRNDLDPKVGGYIEFFAIFRCDAHLNSSFWSWTQQVSVTQATFKVVIVVDDNYEWWWWIDGGFLCGTLTSVVYIVSVGQESIVTLNTTRSFRSFSFFFSSMRYYRTSPFFKNLNHRWCFFLVIQLQSCVV